MTMPTLTQKQIVLLATVIPVQEIIKIGEGYLDIHHAEIQNIKFNNIGSAEAISREILRVWSYKNNTTNQSQVHVSGLSCFHFC